MYPYRQKNEHHSFPAQYSVNQRRGIISGAAAQPSIGRMVWNANRDSASAVTRRVRVPTDLVAVREELTLLRWSHDHLPIWGWNARFDHVIMSLLRRKGHFLRWSLPVQSRLDDTVKYLGRRGWIEENSSPIPITLNAHVERARYLDSLSAEIAREICWWGVLRKCQRHRTKIQPS